MNQAVRSHWAEWSHATLEPREREELLEALTGAQRAHLAEHDYVFVPGAGVVFRPEHGGPEQRIRFTHGRHFRTRRGELYVDAEGYVRALAPLSREVA